jgi:hypothetical protein
VPTTLLSGLSYTLFGTQLNGLSQACGYGDDVGCATNYPLVRLRNPLNGNIYYCGTFGHSTMAIATGSSVQSTSFAVPTSVPNGTYDLVVIANGIPSAAVSVSVTTLKIPFDWAAVWQWLVGSLADGPLWGIGPNGPVPVDPLGPTVVAQARDARRQMLQAIRTLQKIGGQSIQRRLKISQKLPRSFDLEAGEGPGESSDEKTRALKKRPLKKAKRKKARRSRR